MQFFPALDKAQQDTFWRTLQTFNVTRIVIALVLMGYLTLNTFKGDRSIEQTVFTETCIVYLIFAVLFALLPLYYRTRFLLQVTAQIGLDVVVIALLYIAAGGIKSGLAILFLFPLAGGAILAPLGLALLFASGVTMVLLLESGYQVLQSSTDATTMQSGLYGAAFFAAVFVINRLAVRLIKQEVLASERGRDLKVQQAINRLIIADMDDGIVVVGPNSMIFTMNPAASRMVGLAGMTERSDYRLSEISYLRPIADAFFSWQARSTERVATGDGSTFVVIKPEEEPTLQNSTTLWGGRRELATHLKLRFANAVTEVLSEERTVIFMQNVSDIENRAQQLKLASMGRLTASIAHEVRNPLSAISHAATLLQEEVSDSGHKRLLSIISANVARLNRMIEDILRLSRRAQQHSEPLALRPLLVDVLTEFEEVHALKEGMLRLHPGQDCDVRFDPLHLREVVTNLLSNAIRYASGTPGSIGLQVIANGPHRIELHVQDDGPAISQEIRAHLFEPFYTTSSKGTGLGLYLARELCMNNGAMLDYEYRFENAADASGKAGGRFVITFAIFDVPALLP